MAEFGAPFRIDLIAGQRIARRARGRYFADTKPTRTPKMRVSKRTWHPLVIVSLLLLGACGGGGESGGPSQNAAPPNAPPPTATFTVGGTVSGLSATVVLQNNAGDDLTISANGGF